jgi:hypothetical protein
MFCDYSHLNNLDYIFFLFFIFSFFFTFASYLGEGQAEVEEQEHLREVYGLRQRQYLRSGRFHRRVLSRDCVVLKIVKSKG